MWILILQIGTARSSQPADDVAEVHSWNRNHGAERARSGNAHRMRYAISAVDKARAGAWAMFH